MTKLSTRSFSPVLLLLPLSLAACSESFEATGGAAGSTTSSTSNGGTGGSTVAGGSGGGVTSGGATTGGSGGATTGGSGGAAPCVESAECGANAKCVLGVCECKTGFAECGAGCIDVQSDAANCGTCGTKCGNKCVGGACDDPVDVAAGGGTTCAVLALGDVYCWGRNSSGQFGSGAGNNSGSPVKVPGLPAMKRVLIGKNADNGHVCGITMVDDLYCWGSNQAGKLGTGVMDTGVQLPAKVSGVSGVLSVGLGGFHSIATTGKVLGWGADDAGQLGYVGNGTNSPNNQSSENAELVAAGSAHTCAVQSSTLTCWGRNQEGQLGIGSTGMPALPTKVDLGDEAVVEVACGEGHTCARMELGDVLCWGFNLEGQVGNGGLIGTNKAGNPVVLGGDATAIAAGNAHSGAIANNDLYLWGRNMQGQIQSAQGSALLFTNPVKVDGLHNVRRAALGAQHTCVLDKSGGAGAVDVVCWGGNGDGQVGNGAIGGDHKSLTEVVFP